MPKTESKDFLEEKLNTHKCLLYWHRRSMGRIPCGHDKYLVVYPGYNTFDSDCIQGIYHNCSDLIKLGVIELVGITMNGTEVEEDFTLNKLPAKRFNAILENTYNPETLDDLSDPSIVNAMYINNTVNRKLKIKEAVGTEADTIDVVEETPKSAV